MAIPVADNFSYKGSKPLDARIQYATVANMKNATTTDLYDGCLAYVMETKKNYQYDSSNPVDETTGKWRELQTGGGGSTYTAGDGIVIDGDEISTDNASAEDMEEIITPLPSVMSRRFKYSTTEQIVGEWIDGKPLYQKVFILSNSVTLPPTTWLDVNAVSLPNADHIISCFGYNTNGVIPLYANPNTSNAIVVYSTLNVSLTLNMFIVQYTKTTN